MATEAMRMLLTVAHPDDETFGCGSLIAHAVAHGVRVMVTCATHGEAGSPAAGRGFDDADMAVVRSAELHQAAAVLGVEQVRLLDWRDSGMDGAPAAGTLAAASVDGVADVVGAVIADFRPHLVVTLDGSDGHRDHVQIREGTLAAVERVDWPVERVYLHCLPQQLMRQWVEELRVKQPGSDHLALGELGMPESEVTTVIDTADLLALRERAITVHASQESPFEIMGPVLRRDFLTVERLRRIRPPWRGGDLETTLF